MRRLRGVFAPHRKNTAGYAPEAIPVPSEVRIPMSMHIGAPAKPVVAPGDEVKVGQLIAEPVGFVSAPIHASVSGVIKSIDNYNDLTGQNAVSITIAADGAQIMHEGITVPSIANLGEFLEAVRDSGVVGLGGAGFPTAAKLTVQDLKKLDYILINGAECEPYITSDTRTMIDDAKAVWAGVELLKKYLEPKRAVICVEDNKPEPIRRMRETSAGADGVQVRALPSKYPQGGEKVMIYNVTGREVPEGGLPLDVGVIVLNCTTVAAIAKYVKTGIPLVSKCVTVDGSAVMNPKNVIAPIGTPIRKLFDYCGGLKGDVKKVLLGGPMMGTAIPSLDMPILKSTNAVLAFSEKDAIMPPESGCIRCGRCVTRCPMELMPLEFERAYNLKKPELLERYKVNLCMECGCCAYSCPAKRPLVQVMKLAKAMLREYQAPDRTAKEKKEAEIDG